MQGSASARLDLNVGNEVITVAAFSKVLDEICNGNISVEELLCSESFDAVISDKDVLLSISRK